MRLLVRSRYVVTNGIGKSRGSLPGCKTFDVFSLALTFTQRTTWALFMRCKYAQRLCTAVAYATQRESAEAFGSTTHVHIWNEKEATKAAGKGRNVGTLITRNRCSYEIGSELTRVKVTAVHTCF